MSLCGTAEYAMLWMLEQKPQLKKVLLCLDSGKAGVKATERLTGILHEHGHENVRVDIPDQKDWNEDLQTLRHISAVGAERSTIPTMTMEQG